MNSPNANQWPGFLFQSVELPNANPLTAGLSGQPVELRGTDSLGFASAVKSAWRQTTGPLVSSSADPNVGPGTPAQLAGELRITGPVRNVPFFEKVSWAAGGILLAVVLVAVGSYVAVRG